MGATSLAALIVAVGVAAAATAAHADDCTGANANGRFATCFDIGNRIAITAGSDGLGGGIAVRHVVRFDDEPDLVWKLDHVVGNATHATFEDRFRAVVYRGHFIRHSRDGHIVLPLGTPKKIFLPFDIGALAEVGRIDWRPGEPATLGIVKMAALVDVARTHGFRRRLAIGPVAKWNVELDRDSRSVGRHVVAPFSAALANLYLESASGRLSGDLRVEAGSAWHNDGAIWQTEVEAEASVERIMLAVNDRPISLVLGVKYASLTDEAIARIGARVVLFDRRDPRVRLTPAGR